MSPARVGPRRGAAALDYLAAVLAVGLLLLSLVAVREHRPERRPGIDPVGHLQRLLRPPPAPRPTVTSPRPVRPRPPRPPRPRPAPPPRPTVTAPSWADGW